MDSIPVKKSLDSTLSLLQSPYQFISTTAQEFDSKIFETRLLLERTICMYGAEAARLFADENLFTRHGAVPEFIRATLLGKGGLQGLDGEAHLRRKELFMSFTNPDKLYHLRSLVGDWLEIYAASWQQKEEVLLYDEFKEILTRAVCGWAGLGLPESDVKQRTKELASMFDAAGSIQHFSVRKKRKSAESWLCGIVKDIRSGRHVVPEDSPIYLLSTFKDETGDLLSPKIAAVEILNLLRPTVAVSLYFLFCCHALELHPEHRERILNEELGHVDRFVSEVRRSYPFFPALFARVRDDFDWEGMSFKRGTRVMLDVYGTNHDADAWSEPYEFNPDRFKHWNGDPYSYIPQGVGDHFTHHRCPGEVITIELMRTVTEFFVNRIDYDVPTQNLRLDLSRLPAAPREELRIKNVRRLPLYSEHFM